MSQRGISAVQTFCFQEVANQKKGEERRWSQAEAGLMGFTTDSIKTDDLTCWSPVFFKHWVESFLHRHVGCKVQEVTRFYRILPKIYFKESLVVVSRSESKDKHMETVMIVTGPLATQAWSSFKKIGITLNPSSVQTTFRYVDVGFQLSRSLCS